MSQCSCRRDLTGTQLFNNCILDVLQKASTQCSQMVNIWSPIWVLLQYNFLHIFVNTYNFNFFRRNKNRGSRSDSFSREGRGRSIRNMARTSRRQFVGVHEKSSVRITGIVRQHPVIDILLGTFRTITRSQKSAGWIRCQTSFQSGSLSIVILVTITMFMGDMLQDHSPEPFDIQSAMDLDIINLART